MKNPGTLSIIATPIGNPADITLRAIEVLKTVDAVVCEEAKPGSTLLKRLGIADMELVLLNEHNEAEMAAELLMRLLNGENLALISDCGTPVFADPGAYLIQLAASSGVKVIPVPGASSLMAALSVLDFKMEQFYFAGFLPREPELRRKELARLRGLRIPIILMDTPYRLKALLEDVSKVFGKQVYVTVAFDLTLPGETIMRGGATDVIRQVGSRKGEFILVVGNS
jgi:16S rRNA (cytidine1402-2'-O)-methyltransferase